MKAKSNRVTNVAAKFGRNDVRTICFSKNGSKVTAAVVGLPKLIIKPEGKGFVVVCLLTKSYWVAEARTAEAAYRKGVRAMWREHDDGIKI